MESAVHCFETNSKLTLLESLFECNFCHKYMNVPVTLWSCDHVFCKRCIESQSECLVCHLPAWGEDQIENRRLETISTLCKQLHEHLDNYMHCEDDTKTPTKSLLAETNILNAKSLSEPPKKNQNVTPKQPKIDTKNGKNLKHMHSKLKATSCTPKGLRSKTFFSPTSHKKNHISSPRTPRVNLTPRNVRGETPLHLAAIQGNVEELELLLKESSNVNVKDNAGWTPLHEACNKGHVEVVEKLLDAGAFIDTPGYENETPLMDAVLNNRVSVVELLLSRGANVNLRNAAGKTAFALASSQEMKQILSKQMNVKIKKKQPAETLPSIQQGSFIIAYSSAVDSKKIQRAAKILDADLAKSSAIGSTHFVTVPTEENKTKRTLKFLQAMSSGAWILQEKWILKCLENNSWISELEFQLKGSLEDRNIYGPLRSNIAKLKGLPRLFDGMNFFLYGNFSFPSPTKQELCELIKAADGQVLTREPKPDSDCVQSDSKIPYHAKPETQEYYYTYYIVYDPSQKQLPRMVRQGKVCTVAVTWMLDCLSQFTICKIL